MNQIFHCHVQHSLQESNVSLENYFLAALEGYKCGRGSPADLWPFVWKYLDNCYTFAGSVHQWLSFQITSSGEICVQWEEVMSGPYIIYSLWHHVSTLTLALSSNHHCALLLRRHSGAFRAPVGQIGGLHLVSVLVFPVTFVVATQLLFIVRVWWTVQASMCRLWKHFSSWEHNEVAVSRATRRL